MDTASVYYAMTMPGLEAVTADEIGERLAGARVTRRMPGVVVFEAAAAPAELLALRTTEDVFLLLAAIDHLGPGEGALRVLHAATRRADLPAALLAWRRARGTAPATWRVVSQQAGQHDFRRVDAGRAVADALRAVLPARLRHAPEVADFEVWLWLHGTTALVGARLSDATMRHRTYKRDHLPASLRPTVAAALVRLSDPQPAEVVVDPLCGAGTILIERGLLLPADRLLGGDLRPEAIALARRNARTAHVGIAWQTWDARHVPLEPGSVGKIITNLPFGKQLGSPAENAALYPELAAEFARLLAPDGRLVALTGDDRRWSAALAAHGWRVERTLTVALLGQPAAVFVGRRA